MFGQLSSGLLGNESLSMPIALGIILLISVLINISSKTGGVIQTVSTVGKLLPLILIMIFGFIKGEGNNPIVQPMVAESVNPMSIIGQLLIAVLFAYDGWINVGAIAGEMKDPGKDLPKAIVGGLSLVMAVYVVINLAYLWVLPADQLASVSSPASAVAEQIFGPMGGKFITVGILISLFGALNGYLLTGPRVLYTLGTQKSIPGYKTIGALNKNNVPANATLVMAVVGCLYAMSGQFNLLTDLAIFVIWIFYTMLFVGVMKLRKTKPQMERPYKVPLYPIIPIIAIVGGVFVVVSTLITQPKNSIVGLIITLIGLPVYEYMKKKNSNQNNNKVSA